MPRPLPTLDASDPIGFHIGAAPAGSGSRDGDEQLARWALEDWERASAGQARFQAEGEETARVRLYWVGALGSRYGEMRTILVNGRVGAALYVRTDTRGLGPAVHRRASSDPLFRDTIVYLTCLHEAGHALGLSHTNRSEDIMYWFGHGGDVMAYFLRYRDSLTGRADIPSRTGLSSFDVQRLHQLYPPPGAA